jgi:hypothetical protein
MIKATSKKKELVVNTAEKPSALEQALALRAQADKLMEQARAEAREKADRAVEDLNSLGLHFRLVEGEEPETQAPAKTITRQKKDIPCNICNFKTKPLHDGRLHRSQTTKKPFTAAELKEKNLTKVE